MEKGGTRKERREGRSDKKEGASSRKEQGVGRSKEEEGLRRKKARGGEKIMKKTVGGYIVDHLSLAQLALTVTPQFHKPFHFMGNTVCCFFP